MNSPSPLKIGVLGSGKGSNFMALHQAIGEGRVNAETVLVASDQPEAGILEFAARQAISTWPLPPSQFKTKLEPEIETLLAQKLKEAGVELVVLAGFMRVIKQPLLDAFPRAIINIHPSLLPAFKGLEAWKQALEAGVPETGCTVHWVDDSLDGGEIIAQRTVPVRPDDTSTSLHARIQEQEHQLLPEVVHQIALSRNA